MLVLLAFISLPAIVAAIGMMCLPSLSEVLRICLERASAWRSPEEFRNRKLSKIAQKMSGDRYDVHASPPSMTIDDGQRLDRPIARRAPGRKAVAMPVGEELNLLQ